MNENEFELNGVVYCKEKAIGNRSCLGCAFCESDYCLSAPPCGIGMEFFVFVEVQDERAKR